MSVSITWVNLVSGDRVEARFSPSARLVVAKARVMAKMGAHPSTWDQFVVKNSPNGDPLDESETLQELGITEDGAVLFLDEGSTKVSIKWVDLASGNDVTDEFRLFSPLRAAKLKAMVELQLFQTGTQYVVKDSPSGDPLDEDENLHDLGITEDGSVLFLAAV